MTTKHTHLAIIYKNFASNVGISHIGLGNAGVNIAKVLKKHGIQTTVFAANNLQEVTARLKAVQPTHVVISAPWLKSNEIISLLNEFPLTEFVVNFHSNVGFLQADTQGVKLMREYIDIEQSRQNFRISGNSQRFAQWLRSAYCCPCLLLPNMYYLDYSTHSNHHKTYKEGGILKIGAFGSIRPLKNFMSAAAAALQIKNNLKVDTEFYINSGRAEGGGDTVRRSIEEMVHGIPGFEIREVPWVNWPAFRDVIRNVNLLLQPSYTESFNMVTADGIAEGVPSVVSEAIDWVPSNWVASADDVHDIATVGERLLFDRSATQKGLICLETHNKRAFANWLGFLELEPVGYRGVVDSHLL